MIEDDTAPSLRASRGGGVRKTPHVINHQLRPEDRPSIDEEGQAGGSGILYNDEHAYALSSSPHFVTEEDIVELFNPTGYQGDRIVSKHGISPSVASDGGNMGGTGRCLVQEYRPTLTPERMEKRQNGRRMKDAGEPMFTLTSQDIHGVAEWRTALNHSRGFEAKDKPISHAVKGGGGGSSKNFATDGVRIRKLTPRECWRLQGFPDWAFEAARGDTYRVPVERNDYDEDNILTTEKRNTGNSDTQLYRQAGNAVTVNVIEWIAGRILESVEAGYEPLPDGAEAIAEREDETTRTKETNITEYF